MLAAMEAKQVLVVRKDLGMRKGKMIAQGAHASMAVFTRAGRVDAAPDGPRRFSFPVDEASAAWLTGRFKKIAVGVDSEAQLLAVHEAARAAVREELDAALRREAALAAAIVEERERTEAVRLVLQALLMSVRRFGLRRRLFGARIAQLGRETPDSGPQAARHPVLLAEARRVLGKPSPEPPAER